MSARGRLSPVRAIMAMGPALMPFADAASDELPMRRLLRLSLFQVSVGMAAVLLIGTLNRVMIVEMGVAAWLVAVMVALPLLVAPFRALIGFRSDNHRSALGWRRVPYLWFGTIFQFSGFAMMPFALIVLSGDSQGPEWAGHVAAAIAFLLVGAGMHTVQTAGLALATDLAPRHTQAKVVALLSCVLLVSMVFCGALFGWLLSPFSQIALIQVVQGAAALTLVINLVAVWQQEPRNPNRAATADTDVGFAEAWNRLRSDGTWTRRLIATGLGTLGFSMQDVLLEPYGGQILGLEVGQTTLLTGWLAASGVVGFVLAARAIGNGADANRIAGYGCALGTLAFAAVALAAPVESRALFVLGVALIGFGAGLFAHGTLTSCMQAAPPEQVGMALGTWGAVQATAAGLAIASGGLLRDGLAHLAESGRLGEALTSPATGYCAVYLLEIALLFAAVAAIGPLARRTLPATARPHAMGEPQPVR
jgi:BCD family chlorophyll transporter-like MFS transporter